MSRKELKKNKVKYLSFIVVLLIITPMYISQYRRIYKNASEINELSVEGIFFD